MWNVTDLNVDLHQRLMDLAQDEACEGARGNGSFFKFYKEEKKLLDDIGEVHGNQAKTDIQPWLWKIVNAEVARRLGENSTI